MSGSCAADCSANVSSIIHSIVSHVHSIVSLGSIAVSVSFFFSWAVGPLSTHIYLYLILSLIPRHLIEHKYIEWP